MKKAFILLTLFFFSVSIYAQNSMWWVDTTAAGIQKKVYLGNIMKTMYGYEYAPMPVNIKAMYSKLSVLNSSNTNLLQNATYTGTWEPTDGFTHITMTMKSEESSALNGWRIQFSKSASDNAYEFLHEAKFTYTGNDSLTNVKLIKVVGAYFRVIYTNTNSSQAYMSLQTMLHIGDAIPLTSSGNVSIEGTVSLSPSQMDSLASESTQMANKKLLQLNRPSGLSYYSNLAGDFTATPVSGTNKIAITGLPMTVDHKDVVYAAYKRTAGDWTYLGNEPFLGTNDTIYFSSASFVSTDQVDIVFVGTPKTQDKILDLVKTNEQSPNWARYSSDNLINETNKAVGLTRYDYSMEGYNYQTIQFDVSASATSGIKIYASENPSASTTIETNWVNLTPTIFGVDSLAFTTAQTVSYNIAVPMQYRQFRIRVYYGHATNSVVAWIRRWF